MKMSDFYTAEYSDGRTLYQVTLDEAYASQNGTKLTLKPSIWLWGGNGTFFVDFVGNGIGCTLKIFDNYKDAENFSAKIGEMTVDEFKKYIEIEEV